MWIALLRGINIGGRNRLAMAELRAVLEALGCRDVRTYIQSGNALFGHRRGAAWLEREIAAAIETAHAFRPTVMVLSIKALQGAVADNPFPEAAAAPTAVHLCFLAGQPRHGARAALAELAGPDEAFVLRGRTLYLHTPGGFGRSRLAARVESTLGVAVTARNWRTVTALLALAGDAGGS